MLAEHLQKLEAERVGDHEPMLLSWRTLGSYMKILATAAEVCEVVGIGRRVFFAYLAQF
jgi:hypothetical protein